MPAVDSREVIEFLKQGTKVMHQLLAESEPMPSPETREAAYNWLAEAAKKEQEEASRK